MLMAHHAVALLESQAATLRLVGERWLVVSKVECLVGMRNLSVETENLALADTVLQADIQSWVYTYNFCSSEHLFHSEHSYSSVLEV